MVEVEEDEDEEEDELEEAPPQEEAPTDNEFDEESHAASEAEQGVAPSDDNDDYEDQPQPTKAKAPAVKKQKAGRVLYDDVQHARDKLNRNGDQLDKRASDTYGFLQSLFTSQLILCLMLLSSKTHHFFLFFSDHRTRSPKTRRAAFVPLTRPHQRLATHLPRTLLEYP